MLEKQLAEHFGKSILPILEGLPRVHLAEAAPMHWDLNSLVADNPTMQNLLAQVAKRSGLNIIAHLPGSNAARIHRVVEEGIPRIEEDWVLDRALNPTRPLFSFRFMNPKQIEEIRNVGKFLMQPNGPKTGEFTDFVANGFPDMSYWNKQWNTQTSPRPLIAIPHRYISLAGIAKPHGTLMTNVPVNQLHVVNPDDVAEVAKRLGILDMGGLR